MKLVGIPHRLCLLDFEILCRLKAVHGIAARSVLLVDPLYAVAFGDDAGRHARVCDEALNGIGAPRRETAERALLALSQLADYCYPECECPRALATVDDLVNASLEEKERYGGATLLVCADAHRKYRDAAESTAASGFGVDAGAAYDGARRLLAEGGLYATLEDVGDECRTRGVKYCSAAVAAAAGRAPVDAGEIAVDPSALIAMDAVERYWAEARLGSHRSCLFERAAGGRLVRATPAVDREAERVRAEDARDLREATAAFWRRGVQRAELVELTRRCAEDPQFVGADELVAVVAPARATAADSIFVGKPGASVSAVLGRAAAIAQLPLLPDDLARLPPLAGVEIVVEVPKDHRGRSVWSGGWAKVSGGSYWWRECRATLQALLEDRLADDPAFDRKADYESAIDAATDVYVLCEDPAAPTPRTTGAIWAKGAVARRSAEFSSRAVWELPPGTRVEVLERATTACEKRAPRVKVATLYDVLGTGRGGGGGGIVGWVSAKTLEKAAKTGPAFARVDHTAEPTALPPDGNPEPIPPPPPIPSARFDLPEGYGPGDEMNVEIPRMATEKNMESLPNLVYTIKVPPHAQQGVQFEVKMLSPMIC